MGKQRDFRLGIDLGGTKILATVIDGEGRIVAREKKKTKPEVGYSGVLERIAEAAGKALASAGVKSVEGAGLGAPGPVDAAGERLHLAANLGWTDKPLAKDLGKLLGVPVIIGNDVNCAALGEARHGAGVGSGSLALLALGTGLGAGLVVDGHLVNGAGGFAGEIGHLAYPASDLPCGCGFTGHLEGAASRGGLVTWLKRQVAMGHACSIKDLGDCGSSDLRKAHDAGDELVREGVERLVVAAAWGAELLGAAVDPEIFVLGGGLTEAFGKPLAERVRDRLKETSFLYRNRKPKVVVAALGDDAVAVGAAALLDAH